MDVKKLDINNNAYTIINRLLEKGNIEAANWVKENFEEEQIIYTIKNFRDFSLRNAAFWALIYKIPLNQIICFQEPYRTIRNTLWPY